MLDSAVFTERRVEAAKQQAAWRALENAANTLEVGRINEVISPELRSEVEDIINEGLRAALRRSWAEAERLGDKADSLMVGLSPRRRGEIEATRYLPYSVTHDELAKYQAAAAREGYLLVEEYDEIVLREKPTGALLGSVDFSVGEGEYHGEQPDPWFGVFTHELMEPHGSFDGAMKALLSTQGIVYAESEG
jgi:hypothetical protein